MNTIKFVAIWFVIIVLMILLGSFSQYILFKNDANTFLQACMRWPGLWIIYFWIASILGDRIFRLMGKSKIDAG